ncbi:hypothetical protein BH09MYX1_BH09MYX1_04890 [soil metagenome]
MIRPSRFAFLACCVASAVACGSTIPTPQAPTEDASVDSSLDSSLLPYEPDDEAGIQGPCAIVMAPRPGTLSCASPCGATPPTAGASCGAAGTQCELGDHPDPLCNDVFVCDSTLTWKQMATASTTGRCAKMVNLAKGCDRLQCQSNEMACLDPSGKAACSGKSGANRLCAVVGIDRPRLGCACSQKTGYCLAECNGGVMSFGPCLTPPG